MTTPLTDKELRRYTQLIDAILSTADLETVTRKKVRKGLEKALGGKDLSDQKVAIKDLIEARFDAINSQSQSSGTIPTPPLHAGHDDRHGRTPTKRGHSSINGHGDGYADGDADSYAGSSSFRDAEDREIKVSLEGNEYDDDEDEDRKDFAGPAKKKHKRSSSSVEDADARLAAELQAQENRLARARTTRGGGTAKAAKPRKQAAGKKKSASKVKEEAASDVDSEASGTVKEKRKPGGGFQKPFNLSYQLADLVGVPQVVKKLWEHIKANELQDPTDKRQIRCDDKMQAVFKQQRIDMFQMNKFLSNHLYPIDEE